MKSISVLLLTALSLAAQTPDTLMDETMGVLTWRPPTNVPTSNVKGFNLHWGPTSRNYTNSMFFGASNTVVVPGPNIGIPMAMGSKTFFAINTVMNDDSVSGWSKECLMDLTDTGTAPADLGGPELAWVSWMRAHPSTYVPPDPTPPQAIEVVMDNTNEGVAYVGSWPVSTNFPGYWGVNFRFDNNQKTPTKTATFMPSLVAPGYYTVSLWWPQRSTLATNVPVEIGHANGFSTVNVNQRSNYSQWVSLGAYYFNVSAGFVRIKNDGTSGQVVADAVKFTPTPQ